MASRHDIVYHVVGFGLVTAAVAAVLAERGLRVVATPLGPLGVYDAGDTSCLAEHDLLEGYARLLSPKRRVIRETSRAYHKALERLVRLGVPLVPLEPTRTAPNRIEVDVAMCGCAPGYEEAAGEPLACYARGEEPVVAHLGMHRVCGLPPRHRQATLICMLVEELEGLGPHTAQHRGCEPSDPRSVRIPPA